MEAAEDGETLFINVALRKEENSNQDRRKFLSPWRRMRGHRGGKKPKGPREAGTVASVTKKDTSCGKRGEAGRPWEGEERLNRRSKMH